MAAICSRFSYQKLKKVPTVEEEVDGHVGEVPAVSVRRWLKPRRRWRQPRVRIAGLRRLMKRKVKLVGIAVRKVIKRFKEGSAHFGELFAANYMFMQVSPCPTTLSYLEKSFLQAHHHHPMFPPPTTRKYW